MRKFIFLLVFLFIIISVPAFSWPLGIGVTSYYSFWEPAWSDNFENVEIDPALLAGPVISCSFLGDFTLTGFLMFNMNDVQARYSIPMAGVGNVNIVSNVERLEGEMSLMYSVNRYFRVLAGYKLQIYNENEIPERSSVPAGYVNFISNWQNGFQVSGPGAGVVVAMPLAAGFSISISTSLIYVSVKNSTPVLFTMGSEIHSKGVEYIYSGIGNNTSVSISYYLPSMNTAISLGGRFQYLRYDGKGDAPELENDYYYGATLTAVYYIN